MMKAWKYILIAAAASILTAYVASLWLSDETASNVGDFLLVFLLSSRIFAAERVMKDKDK